MVSVEEFIDMFSPADRYAAALIILEKPKVVIKSLPGSAQHYLVDATDEPRFFVYTEEFGEDFCLESGVCFEDAVDFCRYFGFDYLTEF